MASGFVELIHAAPDHGSSYPDAAAAATAATAGDGDGTGVRAAVTAPTVVDSSSSLTSALDGVVVGSGGPDPSTAATVTTAAAVAAAPATANTRSGSGVSSSALTQAQASAPAQAFAAAPSQISQVFHSSSSTPPDFNYPSPSTSTSPPSKHSVLHAHRQNHNSSKLPAFRYGDLNKEAIAPLSLLPHQHHQQNHIPPSPVSPDSDHHPETQPNTVNQFSPPTIPNTETTQHPIFIHNHNHNIVSPITPLEPLEPLDSDRSRATTFQSTTASTPATTSAAHVKRSVSLDNTKSPSESTDTVVTVLQRRAPLSAATTPSGQDSEPVSGGLPAETTSKRESFSGQRELLLPKALQRAATDDKRASISRKPPVSYRPRNTSGSGGTASIPPIRSFRSSGERRSLVLDMNLRSARTYDGGDDYGDANHHDRTLRALEGRRGDEFMQWTPPDSAGERPDGDDSGDLFLRIAREDSFQRTTDNGRTHTENSNAISRVARSVRRPLSVAISSYRSPSPPRISRRMSEQESRVRGSGHEQGERTGPPVSYRGHSREPHSEDIKLRGASTPLRASPLTPRTLTYQDPSEPTSAHRRRQPSVDRGSAPASRMASLKQASVNYSHPRAYNSSPLVPYASDAQKHDTQTNEPTAVEGTDSTTSTAAPSTVWDELEELKSRIHRLELTGKLPPTSSAAISRASDERPPTAHTNATTLSASPKRGASSAVQSTETPTLPKDSHPLLHSALAKSKDFLVSEVYDALETTIVDALALTAMMGTAGQPGPISSGASNIGSNSGTVTDRQLRKKADSICRSLTELCLALGENAGATKPQQVATPPLEDVTITSPTITQFQGIATHRRPSVPANRTVELTASPRAVSRYDEKRATALAATALPSPRYTANIAAATDNTAAGRKSSLLFSRTRRAGTEEPEDGRRTSTLLRSRRAGTEEPEDASDRKPILTRGRRATLDPGEDESRFRTPSRAVTEVNGLRPREYISQLPPPPVPKDADTLANSALPRRRLGSTSTTLNTRLAQPAVITSTTASPAVVTPNRRYFDRPIPSRETAPELDKAPEDRSQRQFSLARSGSLNRRVTNRQSMIATPSTTTTSYYR
ncbi:hypothetical protein GGR51DRAFT_186223 [Nemania sp. FL0031]|nr:hypothetical protein GGR51DRAFT_186223 [Nemania sp. FL0031]